MICQITWRNRLRHSHAFVYGSSLERGWRSIATFAPPLHLQSHLITMRPWLLSVSRAVYVRGLGSRRVSRARRGRCGPLSTGSGRMHKRRNGLGLPRREPSRGRARPRGGGAFSLESPVRAGKSPPSAGSTPTPPRTGPCYTRAPCGHIHFPQLRRGKLLSPSTKCAVRSLARPVCPSTA